MISAPAQTFVRLSFPELPGAKVVDVNGNGRVDPGDRIEYVGPAGEALSKTITRANARQLMLNLAVVRAARQIAEAPIGFCKQGPERAYNVLSPQFWVDQAMGDEAQGWSFVVREGKKASDAILDFLTHPEAYFIDCNLAKTLVFWKAWLDVLGPPAFDRAFEVESFQPDAFPGGIPGVHRSGCELELSKAGKQAPPLRPGEAGFILNVDVSEEGEKRGWSGQYLIRVGEDEYFGHPCGIQPLSYFMDQLSAHRRFDGQGRVRAMVKERAPRTKLLPVQPPNLTLLRGRMGPSFLRGACKDPAIEVP